MEPTDAESAPVVTKDNEQNNASSTEKPTTPAKDSKEKEGRKGILNAIRIPLVSSVFSRKKKVIIASTERCYREILCLRVIILLINEIFSFY